MSKQTRKIRQEGASVTALAPKPSRLRPHRWLLAAMAAAVLVFYWAQLTSDNASIHWDAVDVHYSTLKYFGDSIMAGRVPSWTPYIYSGFPFLSDPQAGVWYPLNWPLFLFGVTPGALQASLALHCLLAAWGMYFLALRFLCPGASALAGIRVLGLFRRA